MSEIRKASYTDYLFLFGDCRSAYSDYAVKNSINTGGCIYIAFDESAPSGYICIEKQDQACNIAYGYTRQESRSTGVFRRLVEHVVLIHGRPLYITVRQDQYLPYISSVCISAGFHKECCIHIFSSKSDDFLKWEQYMDRTGSKIIGILERQGFYTESFEEASDEIIQKLYLSTQNNFKNELDMKCFFDNSCKRMDRSMSFIVLHNGEPVAYTLLSNMGNGNIIFEHISEAHDYIRSGVIIMAFARSMEMFRKKECVRASYAMYESNNKANAFRKKLLSMITSKEINSYKYTLK